MPSFLASAALHGALSIQRRTTAASFLRLGGDAVDDLRQPGIGQLLQVLAQRRRHRGLGEQIGARP
jgi:hypothetical protein